MSTGFYKTDEEKMLAKVIDRFYNDEIGCNENSYQDGYEYKAWEEPELIEYITAAILKEKNCLRLENSWMALEAKHIRFMGAARVGEIVTHRVQYRHKTEGAWLWECE